MYFHKNVTLNLTYMLITFIINNYYSINLKINYTTPNMYVCHAHNIHCTSIGN